MRTLTSIVLSSICIVMYSCKSEKQKLTERIHANERQLFNDSTKLLDPSVAADELEAYQKFVESFPEDTASPGFLFKAADLAQGMHKPHEAIRLYRDFSRRYPGHARSATSEFLVAFIYDNELQEKDSAKICYRDFLENHSTHPLAPSAKASLDQIEMGLTDEELVRMFEARLDSANKN